MGKNSEQRTDQRAPSDLVSTKVPAPILELTELVKPHIKVISLKLRNRPSIIVCVSGSAHQAISCIHIHFMPCTLGVGQHQARDHV
jgi:hypothetical protein